METKITFKWSNLVKPTPRTIKIVGNTLSSVATFIGTYSITSGMPVVGVIGLIAGILGVVITNAFAVEEK